MAVTSRAARSSGGGRHRALLLGAAAIAALLGGCGSRSVPAERQGIVVVRGGGEFGSAPAGQFRPAPGDPAFAGAAYASSSDLGEPLAPDVPAVDDPLRDAAITAKRDADPYRISAVDPDALAAAGTSG